MHAYTGVMTHRLGLLLCADGSTVVGGTAQTDPDQCSVLRQVYRASSGAVRAEQKRPRTGV